VFGSEFIGLIYSAKCNSGLAISKIQSRNNPKIFAKNIKRNNQPVKNKIFLVYFLSFVKSILNCSKVFTTKTPTLFNKLDSLFKDLLKKYNTTKKITIKIQVESTVLEIPKCIPNREKSHHGIISHCNAGI
jgi:hypothetical protein